VRLRGDAASTRARRRRLRLTPRRAPALFRRHARSLIVGPHFCAGGGAPGRAFFGARDPCRSLAPARASSSFASFATPHFCPRSVRLFTASSR
jgi:hypothetical protein